MKIESGRGGFIQALSLSLRIFQESDQVLRCRALSTFSLGNGIQLHSAEAIHLGGALRINSQSLRGTKESCVHELITFTDLRTMPPI